MNTPLVVTGHLIVKPGKERTLIDVLGTQLARVHAQPGNYTQEVFRQFEELLAQPVRIFKHFLVTSNAGVIYH